MREKFLYLFWLLLSFYTNNQGTTFWFLFIYTQLFFVILPNYKIKKIQVILVDSSEVYSDPSLSFPLFSQVWAI